MSKVKLVVVDFDGCLCSINSFRLWLLFSFLYLFITLSWVRVAVLLNCFLNRALGKIDRVGMKVEVLRYTEDLPATSISLFCGFLHLFTNQQVVSIMKQYDSEDCQLVLCTAAPEHYVKVYAEHFGFAQIFASQSVSSSGWRENIGPLKLKNIRAYYGGSVILEHVITDHHDDLSLLLESKKRTLVRPSRATIAAIDGRFDFDAI